MLKSETLSEIEDSDFEETYLLEENRIIANKDIYNSYNNLFNDLNFVNIKEKSFKRVFIDVFDPKKNEEETIIINNPYSSPISQPFFLINHKKRGPPSKNKSKKIHLSTDFDNLLRKIQVHFLTFVINLCNDILRTIFGNKTLYNFKQIDYQLKKLINHDHINMLKSMTIKELLRLKISPKIKKESENINFITLNKVCKESKFLDDFFNINYLEFFSRFYYNENKEEDRIFFEGKEIVFSNKTKAFYNLLKKYENHKFLLIDSVKTVYFCGYNSLLGNKVFKIMKNEKDGIELKNDFN